ncbi:ABC transporter ATP-binding protein [Lutispora saccharofermentans]|uniref:ABC transporter ATP-binding protein/permease n=1 Tax=Lutispora saccharofermentans TaxID=3024236 RepID=A0ABT1NJK4_9FIRM|nr:ABC transporter ATP-binding protein [Lutispora saccharofermentans]MCQ1530466.1 ABC transporter ATP-binding protein/permease [Lutispora saccharofermentans]
MENRIATKQRWMPFIKFFLKNKVPWHLYILSYLCTIAMTSINLKLPLLTRDMMQGKIFEPGVVWGFVGLTVAASIIRALSTTLFEFGDSKFELNLKTNLWSKLMRMPMKYFNYEKPSGLVSRVTSDAQKVPNALSVVNSIIGGVQGLVGSIIIMYGMSRSLSMLMIPLIPWTMFVIWFIGRFEFKIGGLVQNKFSAMTGFMAERLGSMRLIKSFGAEGKEQKSGYETVENFFKAELYRAKIFSFIQQPIAKTIDIAILLLVFVLGAQEVGAGRLEVADLIAFYMYAEMLLPSIFALLQAYQYIKGVQGSAAKIGEILESDSEVFKREKSFSIPDSDINFKNISFAYTEKNVLNDLTFTIPKGKVTAIVGPSGSGKTTIFNLLERFYKPGNGIITFGDIPIEDIHLDEWRKAIGYVPQNSPLLSGTIRENICYGVGREVSEAEIMRAAKLANAYDFIRELPGKFDAEVGEVGGKLSGGERQRIAIARTIIKDPDYLLLDEATCSLDARAEQEVQKGLKNLMKGRTTIVIAHNMRTILDSDQIIVLSDGAVNGIGKHEELYKINAIYRQFVDLQLKECS